MVLAVTEEIVLHTIDTNDAPGAVSAALTIAWSSRSVVPLGRPLLSRHCVEFALHLLGAPFFFLSMSVHKFD